MEQFIPDFDPVNSLKQLYTVLGIAFIIIAIVYSLCGNKKTRQN